MVVLPVSKSDFRSGIVQLLVVIIINIPTLSTGLTLGWVSVESGSITTDDKALQVVGGAALTLAAAAVGVPLAGAIISLGRKPALIITSSGFLICWVLTICGGWYVLAGRAIAGLCGAAAWTIAPLLAKEMCSPCIRGAAGGAPVAAHNLGMLLMYLAADQQFDHSTVLWCCVCLSGVHCVLCLFIPESPAFLAANGNIKKATISLSILRGGNTDVSAELDSLPSSVKQESHLVVLKNMCREKRQRRGLLIAIIAVVGQEMCGVLTLLQFAEKVFQLAGEYDTSGPGNIVLENNEAAAARRALLLGGLQLGGSLVALILVERVGRRPLLLWSSTATCISLAASYLTTSLQTGASSTAATLGCAVLADANVQVAPYAVLADMFGERTATVVLLATGLAGLGGAIETSVLPLIAGKLGLSFAFATATVLSAIYAAFVAFCVPETRSKTPEEILDKITPRCCDNKECTKV